MTILPPSAPGATRSRNLIVRHWRGECRFWVSFWVVGVLTGVATWLAVGLVLRLARMEGDYEPTAIFAAIAGVWLITGVLAAWQVTGVWRSGGRTMRARRAAGRGTFWTTMGTGLVIVGTALLVWQFVVTGVPQLREGWKMAVLGDPDIDDYAVRIMRNGTELEISGGIKYGLDRDLRAALETTPTVAVVHLDSPGGRLGEARKVYETIRDRGLVTYVAHECNSACTMVFLAGRERLVGPSGMLGFHAAFFPGDMRPAVDSQAAFLLSNGIDPGFIRRAVTTPSDDMWFPTLPQLEAAGVATGEAADDRFAMSGFGANVTRDMLKQTFVDRFGLMAALGQADPAALDALITTLYDGYVAGATSASFSDTFGRTASDALDTHLPLSADRTVRMFASFVLGVWQQAFEDDPRSCYGVGDGPVSDAFAARYLGDRGMQRFLGIVEEALWTSDPGHALTPEARDAARAALDGLVADLPVRRPADGATVSPADEAAYCRARLTAWQRIDALGADAVPILRLTFERRRDDLDALTGD